MLEKMSRLYAPTLKEDPTEADLASHKLLLRAGMIRKTASGLYSYLPLAWRSLEKIETIVREEMDSHGGQEVLLPVLTPAELWRESGRWDVYGPELMRVQDRHEREFALGPTHEETMTDLVNHELKSYKQLPQNLYQIQQKFRDELRPRFGLMRGREFIMKDAYSFDADEAGLKATYDQMYDAYDRIFKRCGLHCVPVAADSGQIGGSSSIEFMALAEYGEAAIVHCDQCGYAADEEAATAVIAVADGPATPDGEMVELDTPGAHTIEEVAALLGVDRSATRKSIALVNGVGEPVVAIVPGDHELNDVKASHAFGDYRLMTDEELESLGLVKGCIGPVGLPEGVLCVCDISLQQSLSWLVGANLPEKHLAGACPGRDFTPDEWLDLASAKAGDRCPECGAPLKEARGIEVGQIFQLGDKYSRALHATFLDQDGKERFFQMGCYGIGVTRTLAAVVEQSHDEAGIVWPVPVAPFEVEVLPLDVSDDLVWPAAQRLADELAALGVQTLLDDRKERAGVKFNDADLLGLPYQVVLGKRGVKNGTVELKDRADGERTDVPLEDVASQVAGLVDARRM
ncbi:proline--tRNA ligase [Olsenella sp. YH-ols2217]|uniref:Proline--tRNA ligase n=1 Tax=Kribbibacterium absianum TaxID=3044210 RepID=A0ABT6ZIV9_9ACTN|nr:MULTISPECIES: proline--tRNA ligase [unclassified Olsenella]MDJ1121503.1 proline--tRNA ligase [Olsenella sp. YH-ols2216]MDJ1128993.1 proline--tRNA ligase [Olsenella sp. YH-ols2217]